MKNYSDMTIAEIVKTFPSAASVFESQNIDYCCGGKKLLRDVLKNDCSKIESISLDIDKQVNRSSTTADIFQNMSIPQMTDYIVRYHHAYVKSSMTLIVTHLNKVNSKHGMNHPEIENILRLFKEVQLEMTHHMAKEEAILFPRLNQVSISGNQISVNSIEGPVRMMEAEHELAGRLLKQIRVLTNNYQPPADACNTFVLVYKELENFEKDLHQHVHLENNILFPNALALLNKGQDDNSCSCTVNFN
jgi:regulator of cell morphogenesis and NO signaling